MPDLNALNTFNAKTRLLNVVVETPRGRRVKLRYDAEAGVFTLGKVLDAGLTFPFDFGFVPSTLGPDGDPLDVLLLLDEPLFPGCVVPARLIGVIEAEQTEDGQTQRNDRLLAVCDGSPTYHDVHSLDDLPKTTLSSVELFFATYHRVAGNEFKPLGRHGPSRAEKLVKEGQQAFRDKNE